jgi:hypothetical protein
MVVTGKKPLGRPRYGREDNVTATAGTSRRAQRHGIK